MNMVKSELLHKIANMVAYSVPEAQVAMVCGIDVERLQAILELEEFQTELAKVEFANVEQQKTLNEGWDAVENAALAQVVSAMQTAVDPDYALKVAAVANKANRRGGRHNKPINGDLGTRTVVTLNNTFVERLQQNVQINGDKAVATEKEEAKQKDHNFLPPKSVASLLKLDSQRQVEAEIDAMPAFAI